MATIKNARDIALQATTPRVVYSSDLATTTAIANAAKAAALAAQTTADNVNNWLTSALSDDNLSTAELNTIRGSWDGIVAERAAINSQASTYAVSSTAYNNALVALGTFLHGSAWTSGIPQYITTSFISGVTASGLVISATTGVDFRAKVSTFELARTAVFQGISDKAATLANYSGLTGTVPAGILNSNVTTSSIGAATTGALATTNSNVTSATNTANAANATANSANAGLANKLTNGAANILSTGTALQTSGYAGGNGLIITNTGILAKKAGVSTFAIASDGTATFSGLISGSNGQFTTPVIVPAFNTIYPVSVVGTGGAFGVFGSGTSGGVYGQSVSAGAWAVTGDNPLGGVAVYALSKIEIGSGGLSVTGGIRLGTAASDNLTFTSPTAKIIFPAGAPVCPNLNANYVGGFAISSICYRVGTNSGDANAASGYINIVGAGTTGIVGAYVKATGSGSQVALAVQTTAPSDRRIKSNVEGIEYGLDFVNKLRPVSYTLNSDPKQQTGFGFISQEVQELTGNNESSLSYYDEELENGDIKGLNVIHYPSYIAVLTKAIQELSQELQILKQEVRDIKR